MRASTLSFTPFYIIVLFLVSSACTVTSKPPVQPITFMEYLYDLKGKQITGNIIHPTGREAPFRGEKIWLEVKASSQREIRLPIYRNQQVYRTLILSVQEQGVFLQHENKMPDGTQAEISMYGGYNTGVPSPHLLVFPADAYTRQLMGALRENVWSLALNNDKSLLSYIVEENGHVTLQIDFNISDDTQKEQFSVKSMIDLFR